MRPTAIRATLPREGWIRSGGTMRRSAIVLVAVVLALGLAVSCSRGRSDQQVATDIKAKMYSDPQLKTSSLDVYAKNGEVTLRGEVPSDAARYQAFKLA